MNVKFNTIKRLKLLELIDRDDVVLDVIDALNLLGVRGITFTPIPTFLSNGLISFPLVEMRYGSNYDEKEDIWADNTEIEGWKNYGEAMLEAIDRGVEWFIGNIPLKTLTKEQKECLKTFHIRIPELSQEYLDKIDLANPLVDVDAKLVLTPSQKELAEKIFGDNLSNLGDKITVSSSDDNITVIDLNK